MKDTYDIERLKSTVRDRTGQELEVIYLEETDSTNVRAGEYVKSGGAAGYPVLVIADNQTAGRGRLGHTWKAQPGEGISMSLIVDPCMDMQSIPQITLTAGIAVRRAIEDVCGLQTYIKWPNDVLARLSGAPEPDAAGCREAAAAAHKEADGQKDGYKDGYRKLCGILCAMSADKVICGIGVNVHTLHFPEDIAKKAASVDLCTGRGNDRTAIAAAVISELLGLLDVLRSSGWSALKAEYDMHCVNREGRVLLTDHLNPRGKKTGTAYGTDERGHLRVTWDDGKSELLDAGEIELI